MDLKPGTMVTASVRLVELLGEGGMGSVWVAHHQGLDAEVAVKFIATPRARSNPKLLARFKREASLAAKIKSPHAVQTYDHGVMDDGTPYIVMERLHGTSLGERLRARGRFTLRETALLIAQTAQVLGAAHALGVVHRDIKPANLFLVDTEYELFVKVLDFGIARQLDEEEHAVTATGEVVGTPEYLSPEQLLGSETISPKADLWALGVVTYQCLTGRVPFTGKTLAILSMAILEGKFAPPSEIVPALPTEIDAWCRKALARDAADRFASARELASELSRIATGATGSLGVTDGGSALLPASADRAAEGVGALSDTVAAPAAAAATSSTVTGTITPAPGATVLARAAGLEGRGRLAVGVVALLCVTVGGYYVLRGAAEAPAPAAAPSADTPSLRGATSLGASAGPSAEAAPPGGTASAPLPSAAPAAASASPAHAGATAARAPSGGGRAGAGRASALPVAKVVEPPAKPAGKPADCARQPFFKDAMGKLVPRPECM
jgi:serine/threonine-protein kinase